MPISFVCFLSLRVCKWWECSLNYIKKVYIKNKESGYHIFCNATNHIWEIFLFIIKNIYFFNICFFYWLQIISVLILSSLLETQVLICFAIVDEFSILFYFFKYHVFFNSFSFSAELEFFILPVILLTWYWVQTSGLWSRSKCLKKEMLYCSDPHWILYTWLLNCAVLLLSNMTLALLFSKSSG